MPDYLESLAERLESALSPILAAEITAAEAQQERADAIKSFINSEDDKIRDLHNSGLSGLTIAGFRASLIDVLLQTAFRTELGKLTSEEINDPPHLSLIAVGGYGRAQLNPGSDLDILFLLPKSANSYAKDSATSVLIQNILYLLWDTGFKVGYATRSVIECIKEAKDEQQSKTAMMDARLLAGDEDLFIKFTKKFESDCLQRDQQAFLDLRIQDISSRHKKYSHTVFLQEPHVKESCGGLRDFHNILWVARAKRGTSDLKALVDENILSIPAYKELIAGYDFIHRVRNELHYYNDSNTDILTLRLQGVVATNFEYPQESILRRCEAFMKDYYTHTRNIYRHTSSLMETFQLEVAQEEKSSWLRLFSPKEEREVFDGFIAENGLIYAENSNIFKENAHRLMRVFQHCQIKGLGLSPPMRKLLKENASLMDESFRYSKSNRETFRAMLERKGDVASTLRMMHRVGLLGAYLPEFGALDCLVQHEFFHRYTADEHTLRCIDQVDMLVDDQTREHEIYRNILMNMGDPYALYLALIMHDTGRAENVREHTDGSALLTSKVCTRMRISGTRRSLITFLVDHHLTFWRYATNRNLDDPAVIEEFANIMGSTQRLSTLFLFTYVDSNGTNEEAWSPWKESLMLQLYHSTTHFLQKGQEKYRVQLNEEKEKLLISTKKKLDPKYHDQLLTHFNTMPMRYFRFRESANIATHVKSVSKFFADDEKVEDDKSADLRWMSRPDRAYTELIVTCRNRTLLLEKVCCALASEELNIIAADVYTRTDEVACDLFQVCTMDHQPVTDVAVKKRVANKVKQLVREDFYDPSVYLQKKKNYLRKDTTEGGIPFPVRAFTNNHLSATCTAIEIQAQDRIALLHDLFLEIGKCGLASVHARICTEKGAAMDTIYVTYPGGGKVEDPELLERLEKSITELLK
ncbi:MAG: [protein-PII] uridylyltransferase [Rubritalea sp.]|jgi:[protein-PII] uridylyltransferase|tara:strand:+ start:1758 stop:4526 length:2769 start_codon:yes stop_codon:yes gene_type:complete